MNNLIVPPSPNWYSAQILACAPDNTLLYGSKNDVVVIFPSPCEKPLQIKFLERAHGQKIVSVDVNIQWSSPNKWAVTTGDDYLVKLWDLDKFEKISSHEAHKEQKEKLVGARFLTEDRILSVAENGTMYIWHPSTKDITKLNNFFLSKVTITCFSPCPHATYITAFGLKNGLIVVANLKKNGTLMYKLRGHISDLISLSWCPAPFNVFPSKPNNYIKGTIQTKNGDSVFKKADDTSRDIGIETNEENKEPGECITSESAQLHENSKNMLVVAEEEKNKNNSIEALPSKIVTDSVKKQNPWVNLKFLDDDEVQNVEEPVREIEVYDFLKECDLLKAKIEKVSSECETEHDKIMKKDTGEIVVGDFSKANIQDSSIESETDINEVMKESEIVVDDFVKKYDLLKAKIEELSSQCETENNEVMKMENCETESLNDESNSKNIPTPDSEGGRNIQKFEVDDTEKVDTLKNSNLVDSLSNENIIDEIQVESAKEGPSETEGEVDDILKESNSCEISRQALETSSGQSTSEKTEFRNVVKELCETVDDTLKKHDEKSNTPTKSDDGHEISDCVQEEPCKTVSCKTSEEEPRREFLLASSGRDRAGTDGRMQCFFKLPEKKVNQRDRGKKVKDVTWTVVKWITPFSLLTATKKGELLKYTLPKPMGSQKEYTMLHNEHSSFIFSIAAHVPILKADNWLTQTETTFWTFGHDMYLFNTVLNSKINHLVTLETFCTLVFCLAQSPLDPSRVAMGLSNGTIKIWNTNNTHVKSFSGVNYAPKIHSRITCLAWHPTNELIVAFSTEEGTVGLLNTSNSHRATWFKQSFSNVVHKIQWGPCNTNEDKIGLYATGEGDFVCFNPEHPKEEPLRIKLPDSTSTYSFAWKLDKSLLLVVDSTGKMIIFNSDFSIKATYYQKKKISSISWHPDSECTSGVSTSKSYWAAAALDNDLHIYDFSEVQDKDGTLNIQDVTKAVLKGHQGYIRSLAWSPFNADWIVTAGEDGMAHVWDVSSEQILASYYGRNFEPIKAIIWSPIKEDLLISSAINASLIVWSMSDYPTPLDEDVLAKHKLHMKNDKKSISTKADDGKTARKLRKSIKNSILPSLNSGNADNAQEQVKLLEELLEWKENGNDLKINGAPNIKYLFGSKDEVLSVFSFSEMSHVEKGKFESAGMVSFWKGDLQDSIKEAIDQRRVSPLLISLAPSVSISLWQKACETYAQQLDEKSDSDPLEIATYYLACQNIEKAIECLCEREMFKEALALAKCRLPEDNVFVRDIIHKWASFSAYCGSFEIAAQCYIVLGKYEEAVKVLFRRSEIDILNFALKLAEKSNNSELVKAVQFRCQAFAEGENGDQLNGRPSDKRDVSLENNTPTDEIKQTKLDEKLKMKAIVELEILETAVKNMETLNEHLKKSNIEKQIGGYEINGIQEIEEKVFNCKTETIELKETQTKEYSPEKLDELKRNVLESTDKERSIIEMKVHLATIETETINDEKIDIEATEGSVSK